MGAEGMKDNIKAGGAHIRRVSGGSTDDGVSVVDVSLNAMINGLVTQDSLDEMKSIVVDDDGRLWLQLPLTITEMPDTEHRFPKG